MNILRVVCSINPAGGGVVESIRQTAVLHVKEGHNVEIICLDSPHSSWVNDFPVKVHALSGKGYYGYTRNLTTWLRSEVKRFDCVIIEGLWQYHSFGAYRVLRKSGVPYYVFTHGMLDPWFNRRYPLKYLKKLPYWIFFERRVLRDARAVFFTCVNERESAGRGFPLYSCNGVVVEFGTAGIPDSSKRYDVEFLNKHTFLNKKRRIIFLGRVHPKKGADLLIKAFAEFICKYEERCRNTAQPVAPFVLILAGPADGAYAETLKLLARGYGVDQYVYWTGMLTGDDKWGAIQSAEVFVLPSHQENFGIAVVEALSAGVPVLISRAVNIWSDIVSAGGGFADEDTVDGCFRLLSDWELLTEEDRSLMQSSARKIFNEKYTASGAACSLLANLTR